MPLELANRLRDRRLGEAEAPGLRGEAARLGDGQKGVERAESKGSGPTAERRTFLRNQRVY
jgi:hypothetical protein